MAALCLSVLAVVTTPPPLVAASRPDPAPKALPASPRAKEARWLERHEAIKREARKGRAEIVFLGDSITQGWLGVPLWKKHFGDYHALNAGIASDRVEHMLWRVKDGALDGTSPKAIVLLAGVNNLAVATPERIAATHRSLITELRRRHPTASILLLAVFPSGAETTHPRRARIARLNAELARLADLPGVTYLDIGERFLEKDGSLSRSIMYDHLHLTRKGYAIWADAMRQPLGRLLSAQEAE